MGYYKVLYDQGYSFLFDNFRFFFIVMDLVYFFKGSFIKLNLRQNLNYQNPYVISINNLNLFLYLRKKLMQSE